MVKKFIDNGRIVTLLTADEAKKILEMYINYCLGKREVKSGRLNLVNYLADFIKYAESKDIVKFYDVLLKEKETFEFSKSDLKAYESLLTFFEIYNGIEKGELDLNNISNYIISAEEKKQVIDKKEKNNEELNFEEKLNNIFFSKDFDLLFLAKKACDKWEEKLHKMLEENPSGIDISLKDEIAYQDLLALCENGNIEIDKNIEHVETKEKEVEIDNEVKEEKQENSLHNEENIEVSIPSNEKEEHKEENKKEDVHEETFGPIIVNSIDNNETDKEDNKEDTTNNDNTDNKNIQNDSNDEIIGSNTIREVTQDISLRDAAIFFNGAIDEVSKNNTNNDGNESDSVNNNYGTLRDQ